MVFHLGVVGSRHLTPQQQQHATWLIDRILDYYTDVSYHPLYTHSGGAEGIDTIFHMAVRLRPGVADLFTEHLPTRWQWSGPGGFQERNIQIAEACDFLYCIQAVEAHPRIGDKTYGAGWTYDYKLDKDGESSCRRYWV